MVRSPLTQSDLARGRRLGALLRRARGERSLLETALAAGVSPETLRKIETGRIATPAFPTIAALADTLGLSLDAIWADINEPDRDERADHAEAQQSAHRSTQLASSSPAGGVELGAVPLRAVVPGTHS